MARRRSSGRQRAGSVRRRLVSYRRRLRFEPLEDRRLLAVYAVTTSGDASGFTPTGGAGTAEDPFLIATLRSAIEQANAASGADMITFDSDLSGATILLGGMEIEITETLTIDATSLSTGVTIDAQQLSRIFNITAGTGDITLGGLTLTGGRTTADFQFGHGGAIRSLTTGNLTLDQSTVSGNSTTGGSATGGGIYASSAVTLTQSTVSGNSTTGNFAHGGGIWAGELMLTQSTVSGNSTTASGASGGGIRAGELTLTQSTVSGNYTTGSSAHGGGIRASSVTLTQSTVSGNSTAGVSASGGGIQAPAVTLIQSTVSGNSTAGSSAHGGGIWAAELTLTKSTITDNRAMHAAAMGGGLFLFNYDQPFSISGSMVAGNTSGGGGADLVKDPQSTLTVNYSLIGVADGLTFAGNVGNLTGTAASPLNPQLGPLTYNGGPTWTHYLLEGSPAIDMGDPSIAFNPAEFDQRGAPFVRVFDGDNSGGPRIDIGAVERQAIDFPLVVDTLDDVIDGNTVGDFSLRKALALANLDSDAPTITFDPALTSGGQATILLTLGELAIKSNVTIDGPGAELLTIRAYDPTPETDNGDGSRIFNVDDGTGGLMDVVIGGLTLTGGDVSANGGAIFTRENLTLIDSIVTDNRAFHGGGIYNASGTTEVVNSTISGNTGLSGGGGIYSKSITDVTGSTLSDNRSTYGGGIYNAGSGALRVANSTLSGNFAESGGGGIDNHGTANFSHCTVTENGTYLSGAGIRGYGTTTLDHTIVSGNVQGGSPSNLYGGSFSGDYNLVGTDSSISGLGNISSDSPGLGPLADNGGPTMTHTLSPGSPAIDAGDPGDLAGENGVPEFDQRGMPFTRVHDGRIDIGAFELQPAGPALPGDFNGNGAVENADLTLLLNNWGSLVPPAPAGWVGIPLTAPAVDNDELTALLNNWGQSSGGGAFSGALAGFGELSRVEPVPPSIAIEEPANQPTAPPVSRVAMSRLFGFDAPFGLETGAGSHTHRQPATMLPDRALSSRAVDLLLAVMDDSAPNDAADDGFAVPSGKRHDAAVDEATATVFDLALAALDTAF